jgi:hypothetical protein
MATTFHEELGGLILTWRLEADTEVDGWLLDDAWAWLGADARGRLVAVAVAGESREESRVRLLRAVERHADEIGATLDRARGDVP